ncbi:hypothetical protein V2J66_18005 [Pseudomonas alliivorans]|nr:hypothetical protein [Pseudomonas alliivorans]MEE5126388.1 hypothetical protein [Pseudomonas alliivorans]MEE5162487.1 hypothetical protein [Pseudomonas alliivorans]
MGQGVLFKDNTGPVHIETDRRVARSSVLGKLIEIIATAEPVSVNLSREPAEIEKKIQFNDLTTHRWIIQQYVENALLVDSSVTQLNRMVNSGSTKLKRQMKLFYWQALTQFGISKFPDDLQKLQTHSNNVVAKVLTLTGDFVRSSSDLQSGYFDEDIEFGVVLITSYSIIECIVLENPNDHN